MRRTASVGTRREEAGAHGREYGQFLYNIVGEESLSRLFSELFESRYFKDNQDFLDKRNAMLEYVEEIDQERIGL